MKKKINPALQKELKTYISRLYPIDCSLGTSPFGVSPHALEWLKSYEGLDIHKYIDYAGVVDLTVSIGEYINCVPANIFIENGSFGCLEKIFFRLITGSDKKMLGVGPQFVSAVSEWILSGGEYESLPLNFDDSENVLPIKALCEKISTGEFTVLYLDNPNNPLGYTYSVNDIEILAQCCDDNDTFFIVDEAYGEYMSVENSAASLIKNYKNIMVVRSFSKGFGLGGAHIGYVCVTDEYVDLFRKIMPIFPCTSMSVQLADIVIQDVDFITGNRKRVAIYKKELMGVFTESNLTLLPTSDETPIFSAYEEKSNLYLRFSKLGIHTESGEPFSLTLKTFDESYCRVRIPQKLSHIKHIAYRLKEFWNE